MKYLLLLVPKEFSGTSSNFSHPRLRRRLAHEICTGGPVLGFALHMKPRKMLLSTLFTISINILFPLLHPKAGQQCPSQDYNKET